MIQPHVNVPYRLFRKYRQFILENDIQPEIYFDSETFDSISESDLEDLAKSLTHNPEFSFHAPFMDLSPGGVDPRVREITLQRYLRIIDFAGILRPNVIVFHSGYDKWKYDSRVEIWLERSLRTWEPVMKRAECLDVRFAIENVFEDNPAHLKLLVEKIGSARFGICFDAGHFNLFSSVTLQEWLDTVKPYLIETHLHDNNGTADEHLPIGAGGFDFSTLFSVIADRECVHTIEAHSVEGVTESMRKFREYFR